MDISQRIAHAIRHSIKKPKELAAMTGLSAARISQLGNGDGSIKAEHLYQLAQGTGFSPEWIATGHGPKRLSEQPGDFAIIPQYTARGSAGNGHMNDHVEVKGGLVFKKDWLQRMALKEEHLSVIYCQGNSMEPTLADADVLLIDESQCAPQSRKIYAIRRPDGEISIKRLIHTMTQGWIIRSDNPDKACYPDEPASDSSIGHLAIIGRVVWHGGAL